MVEKWGRFEGALTGANDQHRYGYIGLNDRRMMPLLRPGSIVLVDVTMRRIEETDWVNEYDRPMYFVEVRDGYRCGWFHQAGSTPGHAAAPAVALLAGVVGYPGRSRSRRPRRRNRHSLQRALQFSAASISSSARVFEQKSSLR